jgi:nicotinamidase-related amidase
MDSSFVSRRKALQGLAVGAAALSGMVSAKADEATMKKVGGLSAIPEMAPQWKGLNFAEILSRPAAYCSVSQTKSVYDPGGLQSSEGHRQRGSLQATIKVVQAARKKPNFVSYNWIGYELFRQSYPQNDFDRAQFGTWTKGLAWTKEQQARDNELVGELRALVHPGDNEFNERALQSAWIGTAMPLELTRKRVQVIVLTGIHLDWCIEGNARLARDNGYLPIVIGDACGCQKPEQEAAAMERINNFFAPVISADTFVSYLNKAA